MRRLVIAVYMLAATLQAVALVFPPHRLDRTLDKVAIVALLIACVFYQRTCDEWRRACDRWAAIAYRRPRDT